MGQNLDCCKGDVSSLQEFSSQKSMIKPCHLHQTFQNKDHERKLLISFVKTLALTQRYESILTKRTQQTKQESSISLQSILNKAVQQKLAQLEEYAYHDSIKDGIKVEKRPPFSYQNGDVYDGEWRVQQDQQENLRHGKGKMIFKDGSIYEGYWRHDQQYGKGRIIYANGDLYEGDWQNGVYQGNGTLTIQNQNSTYVGQFYQGKKHGKGKETFTNGNVFDGIYDQGRKQKGTQRYPDNSYYEGQFENEAFHGQGTFKWLDGRKYEGNWKNNQMHGKGIFTWKDGKYYEGDYVENLRHGYGVYKNENNEIYDGQWEKGKQQGKGTFTSGNQKYTGFWNQGQLDPNSKKIIAQEKHMPEQQKNEAQILNQEVIKVQ